MSWKEDKRHPTRYQPEFVYYNEDDPAVTSKQLKIMADHGIDFVVFDSYWQYCNGCNKDRRYDPLKWRPLWDHVLDNIFETTNRGLGYPGRSSYESKLDFHGTRFAIKWSNDFTTLVADKVADNKISGNPKGCRGFFEPNGGLDRMIDYWRPYLQHPNHLTTEDGRPYFYIGHSEIDTFQYQGWERTFTNTVEGLCGICADDTFFDGMGADRNENGIHSAKVAHLLKYVQDKMGLGPLHFIAVLNAPVRQLLLNTAEEDQREIKRRWIVDYPRAAGFDAVSSYTYKIFDHKDFYGDYDSGDNPCHPQDISNWESYDYQTMADIYRRYWDFYTSETDGKIKFHIPTTAGWNRAPFNMRELAEGKYDSQVKKPCAETNFKYSLWDQAASSPKSFQSHLEDAKDFIDAHERLTERHVMICCWNEFAEGTVIEPTLEHGYGYVEAIKSTFGNISPGLRDPEKDAH